MRLPKGIRKLLDIKEPLFYTEYNEFISMIQNSTNIYERVEGFKTLFKNIFKEYKKENLISQIYVFYWDVIKKEWVGKPHSVFDNLAGSDTSPLYSIETLNKIEKDFKISFRDFICTSSIHNRPSILLISVSEHNYLKKHKQNKMISDYPVVLVPYLDKIDDYHNSDLKIWLKQIKQEKQEIWSAFNEQIKTALSKYYADSFNTLKRYKIDNSLCKMDALLFYLILVRHVNPYKVIYYFPTNILKGTSGGISIFSDHFFQNDFVQRVSRFVHEVFTAVYINDMEAAWREHALHSAAVTIMVRNFSHHHGSHVIPRLKDFAFDKEEINDYLKYIQEKSGLFTVIGLGEPICEGTVSLKEKLDFLYEDQGVKLFKKCFARAHRKDDTIIKEPKDVSDKIMVSPGYGELGIHAMYIIFENYVRNLLKHCSLEGSKANTSDYPVIEFNVCTEDSFAIVKMFTTNYLTNETAGTVEKIKEIICNSDLISETGQPDLNYAGIKEMRICANILAGIPPGYKGLNTLKPECIDENKIGYSFSIPLTKLVTEGVEAINRIKAAKEPKPCFFIISTKCYENVKENWRLIPQRICWIGSEEEFNSLSDDWIEWIKKKSIFVSNENDEWKSKNTETDKYIFLLKKSNEKMFRSLPVIEFKNNTAGEISNHEYQNKWNNAIKNERINFNKLLIQFWHGQIPEENKEEEVKLEFSGSPEYRIYHYFKEIDMMPEKVITEIYSILLTKILIIDNEIYEYAESKRESLKNIGLEIEDETVTPSDMKLKPYHCVVFHLGMLDVTRNIYDINPNHLPPYVRIITGRQKPLEEEVLNKCLWSRSEQIDRTVFLRALDKKDIFETKYKIYWSVLS